MSVRARSSLLSVLSGLPELALVAFHSGVADPFHRHRSHAAGGHLPGRGAPDGHERLAQRAAEHAGQGVSRGVALGSSKVSGRRDILSTKSVLLLSTWLSQRTSSVDTFFF